jgi:hypothetical protein
MVVKDLDVDCRTNTQVFASELLPQRTGTYRLLRIVTRQPGGTGYPCDVPTSLPPTASRCRIGLGGMESEIAEWIWSDRRLHQTSAIQADVTRPIFVWSGVGPQQPDDLVVGQVPGRHLRMHFTPASAALSPL